MDPFEKKICETLQKRKEEAERIVREKSLKPDTHTSV